MKPRMASNASIFADRGDPWMSDKEGRKDFGRGIHEDPDLDLSDMMRRGDIRQAPKRPKFVDPERKTPVASEHRKLVNIARRMNKSLSCNKKG
jgi:hypothetical protein